MRKLFALLVLAVAAATPAFAADKPAKIGFLSWFPPAMKTHVDFFREGMRQLGHVEGESYVLEFYFTDGNRELTEQLVRKLVAEPVDVLVVEVTPAVHIAKEATRTIPIVMSTANALATGLVPSLSHPGGNITGLSAMMTDLAGKRLQLLQEIQPDLRSVAFLGSTKDPNAATFVRETQAAADQLGIKLSVRLVDGPAAIEQGIFNAMKRDAVEAVIIQPVFTGHQDRIVPMAMQARLPIVADYPAFAEAGALLCYSFSEAAWVRRDAYYVDRILKGAKPGDLPVEQPTEFELVINARTAKEFGWTIPYTVLVRADRVIE